VWLFKVAELFGYDFQTILGFADGDEESGGYSTYRFSSQADETCGKPSSYSNALKHLSSAL